MYISYMCIDMHTQREPLSTIKGRNGHLRQLMNEPRNYHFAISQRKTNICYHSCGSKIPSEQIHELKQTNRHRGQIYLPRKRKLQK